MLSSSGGLIGFFVILILGLLLLNSSVGFPEISRLGSTLALIGGIGIAAFILLKWRSMLG